MLPPVPTTRPDINLEGKFRETTNGEPFLQAEDGDFNKILIFTTADSISHLCNADRIYCDGTFYTAPSLFDNIFTIHAFVGSAMFPLVFALLQKRVKHTYTWFFTLFKEICQRHNQIFSLISVIFDFECASRNATVETFQAAEIKGLQSHMEEDSRVWPPERLQRPTRCQQTGSSCSSSTTLTNRQSWGQLAIRIRKCTRQRKLYQTHRLCYRDLDRRQIPTTN